MSAMEILRQHALLGLELLGTAAFAVSGVLSAMRKRMDLVGGLAYAGLAWAEVPAWMPVAACAAVTTGTRLLTLWLGWKLPAVDAP